MSGVAVSSGSSSTASNVQNDTSAEGDNLGEAVEILSTKVTSLQDQLNALATSTQNDKHYIHRQLVAESTWVVQHNLGKFPSISVIDSAGDEIEGGDVHHDSEIQATLRFSVSFSGTAICN
jgi:hypothetical protein